MAVIELHEVSKLYGFGDATTLALDEVFLSVDAGEFVAVMGPSGSGKSTMMNIIGMLDRPTHGIFLLDSHNVARQRSSRRAKTRREKIGFIFQNFNLLPRMTVLDNVALPLAYSGMGMGKRLKRASDMLERVGLRDREHYYPRHLSGGQLQRVAIARALVNNPQIIIADEPTGNLDSSSSRVVMELLSELHRQGNTILLVTHNPELTRYASRVIYMIDGMIVQDETTRIGDIASGAKRSHYTKYEATEDDLYEGVSSLLKEVPGKEVTANAKRRANQKTKKPAKPPKAAKRSRR